MKAYECEQGSQEWLDLHQGIPTASLFSRVVQPGGKLRIKKDGDPYKTNAGELADGRMTYAYELAAERLLNEMRPEIGDIPAVQRGKKMEPSAIQQYEFISGKRTTKIGFITPDHGRWGCSPDRLLVDEVAGLEFKAPGAVKHLEYWNQGQTRDYWCQVQGSLMITGFPVWWFVSYHPNLPEVVIRFERDEAFIEKLERGLEIFCTEVDDICGRIKADGYVPPYNMGRTRVDSMAKLTKADPSLFAIG